MQLEMQILWTRILTTEPILLMSFHCCCQPGTPRLTKKGLSQIMEPSVLTRPYCHLFGVGISRSNAIKDRVRIIQIQQQHSIAYLLAT